MFLISGGGGGAKGSRRKGIEEGGEDAASVGEDVSEPVGMFSGSNSRSGTGGVINGRRVIRRRTRRRNALNRY